MALSAVNLVPGIIAHAADVKQFYDLLVGNMTDQAVTLKNVLALVNSTGLDLPQITTPAAPGAALTRLYSKSDGNVYFRPNGGSETAIAVAPTYSTITVTAQQGVALTITSQTVVGFIFGKLAVVQGKVTFGSAGTNASQILLALPAGYAPQQDAQGAGTYEYNAGGATHLYDGTISVLQAGPNMYFKDPNSNGGTATTLGNATNATFAVASGDTVIFSGAWIIT